MESDRLRRLHSEYFGKIAALYLRESAEQQLSEGRGRPLQLFGGCGIGALRHEVVVALVGSSFLSLKRSCWADRFKRVILMFDSDEDGRKATEERRKHLGSQVWVRTVMLPDSKQPDHLYTEDLQKLLHLQLDHRNMATDLIRKHVHHGNNVADSLEAL